MKETQKLVTVDLELPMAELRFKDTTVTHSDHISQFMAGEGLLYARWPIFQGEDDDDYLLLYSRQIETLKADLDYRNADVVSLSEQMDQLDELLSSFAREHHHTEDEVRLTVAGQGVFEIASQSGQDWLRLITEPGDLVVIPALRRHLFYLTNERNIKCVRLFKNTRNWAALYERATP